MKIYKKIKDTPQQDAAVLRKSLSELANFYQTDKGTADSKDLNWGAEYPLHSCWHYTKTYEKYMEHNINNNISMLEIGVCDKRFPFASVKMWMEYFKKVDFYAMDNFWGHALENKLDDIKNLNLAGVNFIYADQGSLNDWNSIGDLFNDKFDYIVEDGSHWPNHMMISLWKSIKILKPGGYFFMEDIQNPHRSRGWFKYDNSLLAENLIENFFTNTLYSDFLNDSQNKEISENCELIDLVLSPNKIKYLAVFRKK